MVQINFARREVNCKLVYYGPGLSGKTTNLEIIHKKVPDTSRGQLTSIATEQDRTLFFDFLPLDLGSVAGMKTKIFLYTVPGQVYYNSTRKLVLQGVDGIIFVADSGADRMSDNIDSFKNLIENLKEYNLDINKIPTVIQYNKRDLPGALSMEELRAKLNPEGKYAETEAVAVKGDGVMLTLKTLAKFVIERLNSEYAPQKAGGARTAPQPLKKKPAVGVGPGAGGGTAKRTPPPPPPPPPRPPRKPVGAGARKPVGAGAGAGGTRPAPPPPRPRPPQPPPPPPNPGGGGGSKAWIWILLVILLLGGGAAAAYFLKLIPGFGPA